MIGQNIVAADIGAFEPARIGWHSIVPESTLVASSETDDNPVSLLANYLTFDAWIPTGRVNEWVTIQKSIISRVDYLGIAAHNLYSSAASISLEYYNGGWVEILEPFIAMSDNPFIVQFEDVYANLFRLRIRNAESTPYIGVVFLGEIMKFERGVYVGHAPATYNHDDKILNSFSEGGHFLGRSIISEGGKTEINLDQLSPEYVRSTWVPFQDHARLKPFFFSWSPVDYPYEVIYGWSTSIPAPTITGHNYYGVSIGVRGQIGSQVIQS